ncbi:hypothetical protein PIB30_066720 [Stylosanthes scabra]|uniref:Ubiquitin-like protease family profile domain-containing protein n=1 Tax=Stylosanthes scabra TaxID=79078 RepID=A0ABU6YL56_9FABA|nr:hypothetical protein [Stylosanthes scabra]
MTAGSYIDIQAVSLMCHVLNAEENERFKKLVYCVSAEILQRIFQTYNHNWMDKKKKKKKPHEISSLKNHQEYLVYLDREKLVSHRFSNILDQMLRWVGAPSMFNKESNSLLPKYINILGQPNEFDCAVFVMKWMELIDPIILAGCCRDNTAYEIEQWTEVNYARGIQEANRLQDNMSKENSLRANVIKAAQDMRAMRPGAALRSPYTQIITPDLPRK